jgi:MoxR-like ATPase
MKSKFPLIDFRERASEIMVGKEHELQIALTCLLARGHLLIEDSPGMGKTTLVILLSQLLDLPLKRIQFTNDLLPTDILGFQTLNEDKKTFSFHKGAIFSELVLADELNRGTPKTQSALLQAMEEKAVTIDGISHVLPNPFFLIATQNPQEHSGTFPLPESQLDRFMMCLALGYPSKKDEVEVLRRGDARKSLMNLAPIVSKHDFLIFQAEVDKIHTADTILIYIQSILQRTRGNSEYASGLSSRCGLLLLQAARAWCFLQERDYVLPEDVKAVAPYCLTHRLISNKNKNSSIEVVNFLLQQVPIPT